MWRLISIVALVLALFGATNNAWAATEPRVALVIGNSAYKNAPLANPVNDARLMAETLRGLGFDVIERTDATQREMKLAIFELGDRLESAGKDAVGLFYYAGHGVQVDGQNYLIPLNAEISKERHVAIEAVGASWVLGQMEFAGNRVNFVILDACRNNPLTRGFRSRLRGLARMDAPTGSLIAYSTGPGNVAFDGEGANSPYTRALSQVMQMPNLPAEKVFKLVRDAVRKETRGRQTPWEESSMTGADFYFKLHVAVTVQAPATSALSEAAAATQQESLFWESIKDSTDPASFEAYLAEYPNGKFAALAQLRLTQLEETQTAALVPPLEASIQVEEMDATFVTLKTSNLRAEPTVQSERIGQLSRDAPVIVTGKLKDENWYRIEYKGREAYIYGMLITPVDAGELTAWQRIAGSTDHTEFETFLANFPSGHFAGLARTRLAAAVDAARREAESQALEDTRRKEAERKEEERALWDAIKNSDNPADYHAYLEVYPKGRFVALARVRSGKPFDGQWRGYMRCGSCENCPGPLKKPVSINVENHKFDIAPDASYIGMGVIDDEGNINIEWNSDSPDWTRQSRRKFQFAGKYDGESFRLRGVRGPRSCGIRLSRVSSP